MIPALAHLENVIMLYRSQEEMRQDVIDCNDRFIAEWDQINQDHTLAKAAIDNDGDVLEKSAANDAMLAKAYAHRLIAEHGICATDQLQLETLQKVADWLNRYEARLDELSRLSARSRRFWYATPETAH